MVLEKEYYEVKEFDNIPGRIKNLTDRYDNGGTLLGAFDGEKLVGLGSINKEFIGEDKNMIQLSSMHVSAKYRDRGMGRKIVFMLKEKAKQSARKNYTFRLRRLNIPLIFTVA